MQSLEPIEPKLAFKRFSNRAQLCLKYQRIVPRKRGNCIVIFTVYTDKERTTNSIMNTLRQALRDVLSFEKLSVEGDKL